ncbi:hypothetical protein V9K67_21120 [Paraflavisolibacter sp. H34]|uniref:hypothetical protein n=1 Tax=Huijunlia imazamoxiresistens TaxID=3127457 RepID=UPI00301751F5
MPVRLSIKELIRLLYQNSELIDLLFGRKESVLRSEILAGGEVAPERMETLVEAGIVRENAGFLSLDERILTFFQDFLEIGELSVGFIDDNVQALNENLDYYRQEPHPRYVRKIKATLQRIISVTHREIIKLHKAIDDTYRNEPNYKIKMQRLENFKNKRNDILGLIGETEKIYNDSKGLLVSIVDGELTGIIHQLRLSLKSNKDYLIEIQDQIIEYINKVREQQEVYRKCQYLRELKSRGELHHQTSFRSVVEAQRPVLFEKKAAPRTRVPLHFLRTDEGSRLLARVAARLRLEKSLQAQPRQRPIDESATEPERVLRINMDSLVAKFRDSGTDLFDFLVHFPYPEALGAVQLEDKLRLYIEIVMDYDHLLQFSDDFRHHHFINEKGQQQKIGFAVVHAKKAIHETA